MPAITVETHTASDGNLTASEERGDEDSRFTGLQFINFCGVNIEPLPPEQSSDWGAVDQY